MMENLLRPLTMAVDENVYKQEHKMPSTIDVNIEMKLMNLKKKKKEKKGITEIGIKQTWCEKLCSMNDGAQMKYINMKWIGGQCEMSSNSDSFFQFMAGWETYKVVNLSVSLSFCHHIKLFL